MSQITFQKIENSVVILAKGGKLTQHEAYSRRGEIFAKDGSGYVGLRRNGTSVPSTALKDYDLGGQEKFAFSPTGRIVLLDSEHAFYTCTGALETEPKESTKIEEDKPKRTRKR